MFHKISDILGFNNLKFWEICQYIKHICASSGRLLFWKRSDLVSFTKIIRNMSKQFSMSLWTFRKLQSLFLGISFHSFNKLSTSYIHKKYWGLQPNYVDKNLDLHFHLSYWNLTLWNRDLNFSIKQCYFHCFPIHFPWSDGTRCHDLRILLSNKKIMITKQHEKTLGWWICLLSWLWW